MTGKFNTSRQDGHDDVVRAEAQERNRRREQSNGRDDGSVNWPEPKPLPNGLSPVAPFSPDFLPGCVAPWVADIAERLQCPPDYPAIAAMTSLGSVIGRSIGLRPQMQTEWTEVPNLWGAFVGPPGALKSPAMNEALRPLHYLEAEASKENGIAQEAYEAGVNLYQVKKSAAMAIAKAKLKKDPSKDPEIFDVGAEPAEPILKRYRTNDTSYEKLGELLHDNPNGLLVERDELVSLLNHLEREDQAVARGFYLSGWGGTQPYTFDRIQRGTIHLDGVCLSVLGNTQPARMVEYAKRANAHGMGGDGLIQRFGLFAWPDLVTGWVDVDRYTDPALRERVRELFVRLAAMDNARVLAAGALLGPYDKVPWLRFDEPAHKRFLTWREDLERRLRSHEMSPALEGHLAKYRKLVPAIALINHLVEQPDERAVGDGALARALEFATYLETHARRLYGAGSQVERNSAVAIANKIKAGLLKDGFTVRDIQRHGWSNLTEVEHIRVGLGLLGDLDHVTAVDTPSGVKGGRPTTVYRINPREGTGNK